MAKYEVYSFRKQRSFLGREYTSPVGWFIESFDDEADAMAYTNLMSKQDDRVVFRIKKSQEEWLLY